MVFGARSAFDRERAAAATAGKLLIVKMYQPRCKTCVALGAKMETLARKRPQHRHFEVNYKSPEGRSIVEALGKPQGLPNVYIFENGECIYNKPVPVRLFPEILEVLDVFERYQAVQEPPGYPLQ